MRAIATMLVQGIVSFELHEQRPTRVDSEVSDMIRDAFISTGLNPALKRSQSKVGLSRWRGDAFPPIPFHIR